MLLELHDLDRCLRAAGLAPGVTDQRIQPYPNKPALEVRIGCEGQIAALKLLQDEQRKAVRKFFATPKGGKQESTTGFNVDPLWRTTAWDSGESFDVGLKQWNKDWKSAKSKPQTRIELLQVRARHREVNWDFSDPSKINLCLKKAASVLRREMEGAEGSILSILQPLAELLKRSESLDAKKLHTSLSDSLFSNLHTGGSLDPEDLRRLLFSDRKPGDRMPAQKEPFSLVLELDDPSEFGGYPANHQKVWSALNHHIIENAATSQPSNSVSSAPQEGNSRVGIFGEAVPSKIGSMPEKTLPRVGKVKLFSLSHQTPCQARYGLIEADACPVAPELQDRLSAALEWICQEERRGETWDDVSNACGYKQPALLVAYSNKAPTAGIRFAGMLARQSEDTSLKEEVFEKRTQSVVKALQGLTADRPDLSVSVFVITKADTARKKLLYSRQFSAGHLTSAAEAWQKGARDLPPIFVRVFNEERKPSWARPLVPFPNELVRVINTRWELDGKNPKAVSDATIGFGLTLLLETGPDAAQAAREALRPLIDNAAPFGLALGQAISHGRVLKTGSNDDFLRLFSRLLPSALGLLLSKSGHKTGEYMNRNPYQIGRLLRLADELHREYCRHERDNKFPNGPLLGNSLLTTALANPVACLSLLLERSHVYLRVADSSLWNRFGEVEKAVDKDNLPTHCTDEDKAQVLLGYLARPELANQVESNPPRLEELPQETRP